MSRFLTVVEKKMLDQLLQKMVDAPGLIVGIFAITKSSWKIY
jgi:hypothetical protein